jgi:hypothetical protein
MGHRTACRGDGAPVVLVSVHEASESILAGMDVAQPAEDSQESALHLRLVGTVSLQPH